MCVYISLDQSAPPETAPLDRRDSDHPQREKDSPPPPQSVSGDSRGGRIVTGARSLFRRGGTSGGDGDGDGDSARPGYLPTMKAIEERLLADVYGIPHLAVASSQSEADCKRLLHVVIDFCYEVVSFSCATISEGASACFVVFPFRALSLLQFLTKYLLSQ